MHVSSVLIELLTNGGGHMEPRPVEMMINIINIVEWSVCSSPARHASVDWDQSRSVGSAFTVLSELRYCNNNNCHLFT